MVNNRRRDLRNLQAQQRDTRERNIQYLNRTKIWMLLSVCALICAAAFSVLQTRTSSMDAQSKTSQQVTKKTGCPIYEVDPEIDPCDNFYEYACNKWYEETSIPNWSSDWSVNAIVDERIAKTVIEILEQPENDEDIKVITQAKDLYQKCLLHDGDHNKGDLFIKNMVQTLRGMHVRGFYGGNIIPSRTEMCEALVYRRFEFALLHKRLQHNYKDRRELESMINEVQAMFTNVKHAFNKTKSRYFAESYKDTKLCAGYPQWIFNPVKVQTGYNWLNLNKKQTFREQLANMDIANSKRDLFDGRLLNDECHMWYSTLESSLESSQPKSYSQVYLPMRLLESPFFELSRSRAINYGSLGPILALGTAPTYIDWQSTTPMDCLEKQYSSFTMDFGDECVSLNGTNTDRKFFLENVAVQEAFTAFSRMNREVTDKVDYTTSTTCKNKPRDQFTSDQLFFLGYAQSKCEYLSKQAMKFFMERSSRSPGMFQVIGSLQNLEGFAKAWNCPSGSYMNPNQGDKCQVL